MKAILLIDHGSKLEEANLILAQICVLVKDLYPDNLVEFAHMELAEPSIEMGIEQCIKQGASMIIAVPYMLGPGRHSTKDIPEMISCVMQKYPNVSYQITKPLGVHKKIAEVISERIEEMF